MPIVVIFIFGCPFLWLVVVKPPLLWHFDAVLGSGRPFHYVRGNTVRCALGYAPLVGLHDRLETVFYCVEKAVARLP